MKKAVLGLVLACIAVVTAITENSEVYRFTHEDGRKFKGVLFKEKHLRFVVFHLSKDHKSSSVLVADLQRTCGPYEEQFEILKLDHNHDLPIYPLSENKVLLYPNTFHEDKVISFVSDMRIVDLSSCKVSQISVPRETKQLVFKRLAAMRDDRFDIAFHDPELCGENICRQSFDFQGKNVSDVSYTPYGPFTVIPDVYAVGSQSRSDAELAIGEIHGKKTAFLVTYDSRKLLGFQRLQQFTKSEEKPGFYPMPATDNNCISFADQLNSKTLNITQFDLNGNLKFKTVLNYEYIVRAAYLLNSPSGSVYVVAGECEFFGCDKNANHYVVKKISASGKEAGSFVMELPATIDFIMQVKFYKAAESHCVSRLQAYPEGNFTKAKILTRCFNDDDFSK